MGYDWKGWSVLFWMFSALFSVFTTITPADYGLSPIAYKWVTLALGAAMAFTGKMGASWAGKSSSDLAVDPKTLAGRVLLPFVIFGALSVAACKPPASIQTEPGRQAWYASQVLQRVSEVQNIAIQLNSTTPPSLSTNTTRVIVQMCVSSAKVLKEMPNGWAKVVLASFNEVKAQIPAAELNKNVSLQTAFAVLEGILISFAGGTP
jgi:hypothetical protein